MNVFQNRKGQDLQKRSSGSVERMINVFDFSAGMARTKLFTEKPHRDGAEMNGFQNKKGQDLEKRSPERVERMINVFDLSAGMARTKQLTEKAHRDGSPDGRNRFDVVVKPIAHVVAPTEDKQKPSEIRKRSSNRRSGGTPVKMLIAQEMCRESESRQKSPNIVAKLMGLDALPEQQSVREAKRSPQKHYSHTSAALPQVYGHQEDKYFCENGPCEIPDYKDVYEVWQQPSKINGSKDQPSQNGRYVENSFEKRMSLVRQKFVEAKRLATDEKLLHSKEFQDALEILSSNRDIFLQFLEEPNSLKQLDEPQITPPSQTKRITVFRPSKFFDTKDGNCVAKKRRSVPNGSTWDWNSRFSQTKAHKLSQATRIVVLKPSPLKPHGIRTASTSPISSPDLLGGSGYHKSSGTDEVARSREVAREITRQMRENLNNSQGDEALLASVFSNGYVGDESSFNMSDSGYVDEHGSNLTDCEIGSPTSRHSWDYINRSISPSSVSSFSHRSYFHESSLTREAKKRLSERLALVALNASSQEQRQVRRSSSTLGEMLAIPEARKEERSDGGLAVSSSRSCDREQKLKVPLVRLSSGGTKDGRFERKSLVNLSSSKSVSVSSSFYGAIESNVGVCSSSTRKPHSEVAKPKGGKSSLKKEVSNFFFPRNKKLGREKSIPSSAGFDSRLQAGKAETVGDRNADSSCSVHDINPSQSTLANADNGSGDVSSPTSMHDQPYLGPFGVKSSLSLERRRRYGNAGENQEHPSPISVLEVPSADDVNNYLSPSSHISSVGHEQALSRSRPIRSVARSLSWDDPHLVAASLDPVKPSRIWLKAEIEQERFVFVQKLLSAAGLEEHNCSMAFGRWHSLDTPLNPMLLNECLDMKSEAVECKARRPSQKLLFDSINEALLDIGRTTLSGAYPWAAGSHGGALKDGPACVSVAEEVSGLLRRWFSSEEICALGDPTNSVGHLVDRVVQKEVVGRGWGESMWLEMYEFSKEVGGAMLEELVEEALLDLICG